MPSARAPAARYRLERIDPEAALLPDHARKEFHRQIVGRVPPPRSAGRSTRRTSVPPAGRGSGVGVADGVGLLSCGAGGVLLSAGSASERPAHVNKISAMIAMRAMRIQDDDRIWFRGD